MAPRGSSYQKFGHRVIYDAASRVNAKVSSIIHNKTWNWGSARSDDLVTILSKLPLVAIGDIDTAIWVPSKSGQFSIASAWDQIRTKKRIFTWWKILWFTKAIPRIAFIIWLAIRDRLSTKERLASWGIKCDLMCVVLSKHRE